MAINIYYGENASFKTITLYNIIDESRKLGKYVSTNLNTNLWKDNEVIKKRLANSYFMECFDRQDKDRFFDDVAQTLAGKVLQKADRLILDSIEVSLTDNQLNYLLNAIDLVQDQFPDGIYIATNSVIPFIRFQDDKTVNFYLCEHNNEPQLISSTLLKEKIHEIIGV